MSINLDNLRNEYFVIVPVFNEERKVKKVVNSLLSTYPTLKILMLLYFTILVEGILIGQKILISNITTETIMIYCLHLVEKLITCLKANTI